MSKNTDIYSRVFVTGASKFSGWYKKTDFKHNRNVYTHEEKDNLTLKFGSKNGTVLWKFEDAKDGVYSPYALSNEKNPPRVGDRTYRKLLTLLHFIF